MKNGAHKNSLANLKDIIYSGIKTLSLSYKETGFNEFVNLFST